MSEGEGAEETEMGWVGVKIRFRVRARVRVRDRFRDRVRDNCRGRDTIGLSLGHKQLDHDQGRSNNDRYMFLP